MILSITLIAIALALYLVISWMIASFTSKPINEMEKLMKKAKDGDLTVLSNYKSKDELGSLAQSFNEMLEQLIASAEETNNAADHIAETSTLLASSAEVSVEGTENISISMQEMAIGSNSIANAISFVSEHSITTADESQKGDIALNKTIDQMKSINETVLSSSSIIKELGSHSTEIEQIVTVTLGFQNNESIST